jgi:hypothetical protein
MMIGFDESLLCVRSSALAEHEEVSGVARLIHAGLAHHPS